MLTYSDFHSTHNNLCSYFKYQVQASYFSNTSGESYGWDTSFRSSDESSITSSDESTESSIDSDTSENSNEQDLTEAS